MEEERPDALEVAAQKDEEREKKKNCPVQVIFFLFLAVMTQIHFPGFKSMSPVKMNCKLQSKIKKLGLDIQGIKLNKNNCNVILPPHSVGFINKSLTNTFEIL